MATNPYEVEHNVKETTSRRRRRHPDMSTFTSYLDQITPNATSSHAGPTPVDMAALFQLVQDQLATLAADAPTEANRNLLSSLVGALEADVGHPPDRIQGVDQAYLDSLDRVSHKRLRADPEGTCAICAEKYLDDPYPLVVELPCSHAYDLECVSPWLLSKGTCPLCRKDLAKKKAVEIPKDEEDDEEDVDGLYG
ncbi:hypothetical protein GGR50DRAFT_693417 [Xylaria sp. CBS 124048]|nr:hypothetical protein GGR50DRAFT_693417 [Xylaria sp. CBS 124048]